MKEQIFLLNERGELVEMNESGYLTEDLLQKLLADYPNLLSGSQINPGRPRRWLLISREIGVHDSEVANSRWSLDHLFIDQDGIPTLVEVKRSTDTRIRREVIGQILDYAANGVSYWSLDEIQLKFEAQYKNADKGIEETLRDFLEGEEEDKFWENVQTNLLAGKIRMLIVADIIPKELQRVIEFLNGQMSPAEILGVEIRQFIGQNLKTLVPRVVGLTSNAQLVKSTNRNSVGKWTEESFLSKYLENHGQAETALVKQILDWIRPKVSEFWGGNGTAQGSIFPILRLKESHYAIGLWTNGAIEVQFQWMRIRQPFDSLGMRQEFISRLNSIKGVNISMDKIEKRPSFKISVLQDPIELNKFFEIMNWYFDQVRSF